MVEIQKSYLLFLTTSSIRLRHIPRLTRSQLLTFITSQHSTPLPKATSKETSMYKSSKPRLTKLVHKMCPTLSQQSHATQLEVSRYLSLTLERYTRSGKSIKSQLLSIPLASLRMPTSSNSENQNLKTVASRKSHTSPSNTVTVLQCPPKKTPWFPSVVFYASRTTISWTYTKNVVLSA